MNWTRYGHRITITFLNSLFVACLICLIINPFIEKKLFHNEVGYYIVMIHGTMAGTANSVEDANAALGDARLRFARDYSTEIYLDPDMEIIPADVSVAQRQSVAALTDGIYTQLFNCVVNSDLQTAYQLKSGTTTVTMGSKDDLLKLLDKLASRYDITGLFEAGLVPIEGDASSYQVQYSKKSTESSSSEIVSSVLSGDSSLNSENKGTDSGIRQIYLPQDVTVTEVTVAKDKVTSVSDAYDTLTTKTQTNKSYVAVAGDTWTSVAKQYNMTTEDLQNLNPSYQQTQAQDAEPDTAAETASYRVLVPGDTVQVTVSQSVLPVYTVRNLSYEETFAGDITYQDDNTAVYGDNRLISAGSDGERSVTAQIVYQDGQQISSTIQQEEVTRQPVPVVISIGTLANQDSAYKRPIQGGTLTIPYGSGSSVLKGGVTWSVAAGTAVAAAADGQVVRAGWFSDYGICVDLLLTDGSLVRYAHLQKATVAVNTQVKAGQQIAETGSSGNTDSDSLYVEIWKNGATVNPLQYMNKN